MSSFVQSASADELLVPIRGSSAEERRRALRIGAELLDEAVLVRWMREEADDVLRNAGFEMLKLRGRRAVPTAVRLLDDADEDVVLQAILVLEHAGDPSAWPAVRRLLKHENVNLVQAAICAGGRIGTRATAADLLPFLGEDLWLQLAAIEALGQLRAKAAVPALTRLLFDRDLSDAVADALTRIGGVAANRAVTRFWTACASELDPLRWLPLLANCIGVAVDEPNLRVALREHLTSGDERVAIAAAECLLALGDADALERFVRAEHTNELPWCLAHRGDLAERLLAMEPPAREWAWELIARNGVRGYEAALVATPPASDEVLVRLARTADVQTLVSLFVSGERSRRDALARVLSRRRRDLQPLICQDRWSGGACPAGSSVGGASPAAPTRAADRALLLEIAGAPSREVAAALSELDEPHRAETIAQVRTRRVLARLPWRSLLALDERTYAPLLGATAARLAARELVPLVRKQLQRRAIEPLISCCGALRDEASVPLLVEALPACEPFARGAIFRALAAIGTVEAHAVLAHAACGEGLDARIAARALAEHADDAPLFRELALHRDWSVRLAAAEALARCADDASRRALSELLADPNTAVAQRARASLDAIGGIS